MKELKMSGKMYFVSMCTALAVLAACAESPSSVLVGSSDQVRIAGARASQLLEQRGRYPRGIEDDFLRLEADLPGFGGLYLDKNQDVVAVTTGAESDVRVRERVLEFVRSSSNRFAKPDGSLPAVLVKRGDYSSSQLLDHLFKVRSQLRVEDDVVYLDADEEKNRLRIGIGPKGSLARAYGLAQRAGIDTATLHIEQVPGYPQTSQLFTLRDRWRATFAGIQTTRLGGGECSMGFHVTAGSSYYFLTASHCTGNYSGVTGTIFYQPTVSSSNQVGVESVNPAWSTSGCLPGVTYCRLSDAALIQFSSSSLSSKGVGESSSIGSGNSSGNINFGAAYAVASQGDALSGTIVNRTGRTSGTTTGPIVGTCVDAGLIWNGSAYVEIFCGSEVTATAQGGDSGGPVYRWAAPFVPSVRLAHGVVYAALNGGSTNRYWYSSWTQVEADMGTTLWAF